MLRTVPPIGEDKKIDLLHSPLKGPALFGGALAKLQKVNTEGDNALTVFPNPEAPSTFLLHPTLCGPQQTKLQERFSYRRGGGMSQLKDGPAPSASRTRTAKDSQVLTVTVPQEPSKCNVQEHEESPCPKGPHRLRHQGKGPKKSSELGRALHNQGQSVGD